MMRLLPVLREENMRLGWLPILVDLVGVESPPLSKITDRALEANQSFARWLADAGMALPAGKLNPSTVHDSIRMLIDYHLYDNRHQSLSPLGQVLLDIGRWEPNYRLNPLKWYGPKHWYGFYILIYTNGAFILEFFNHLASIKALSFAPVECVDQVIAALRGKTSTAEDAQVIDKWRSRLHLKNGLARVAYPLLEPLRDLGYLKVGANGVKKIYELTTAGQRLRDHLASNTHQSADEWLRSGLSQAWLVSQDIQPSQACTHEQLQEGLLKIPDGAKGTTGLEVSVPIATVMTQAWLAHKYPGYWIDEVLTEVLVKEMSERSGSRIYIKRGTLMNQRNIAWQDEVLLADVQLWASQPVLEQPNLPGTIPFEHYQSDADLANNFEQSTPMEAHNSIDILDGTTHTRLGNDPASDSCNSEDVGEVAPDKYNRDNTLRWLNYCHHLVKAWRENPAQEMWIGPLGAVGQLLGLLGLQQTHLKPRRQVSKQYLRELKESKPPKTLTLTTLETWIKRLALPTEVFDELQKIWQLDDNTPYPSPNELHAQLIFVEQYINSQRKEWPERIENYLQEPPPCSSPTQSEGEQWEHVKGFTQALLLDAMYLGECSFEDLVDSFEASSLLKQEQPADYLVLACQRALKLILPDIPNRPVAHFWTMPTPYEQLPPCFIGLKKELAHPRGGVKLQLSDAVPSRSETDQAEKKTVPIRIDCVVSGVRTDQFAYTVVFDSCYHQWEDQLGTPSINNASQWPIWANPRSDGWLRGAINLSPDTPPDTARSVKPWLRSWVVYKS